jgi:hypothetical protein
MHSRQLIFSLSLTLLAPSVVSGEVQCPGNVAIVRYHSLGGSKIAIPVTVNGSGPYQFMVDTGSQITIIEPSLAADLHLQPQGSINVASVVNSAKVDLVIPELVEAGPYTVHQPLVAVQSLSQLQAMNPDVRGILGETFLAHFDLLIDNAHKILCFDDTRRMQEDIHGEHLPLLEQPNRQSDLPFTQPLLISVHLPGDGSRSTILNLDSGTNVPLLYANHLEAPPWLQKNYVGQGRVVGGGPAASFAVTPAQEVRIGSHIARQISFLTPVSTGPKVARGGEDGLLPTALFKRVFISHTDRFVVFDPQ